MKDKTLTVELDSLIRKLANENDLSIGRGAAFGTLTVFARPSGHGRIAFNGSPDKVVSFLQGVNYARKRLK